MHALFVQIEHFILVLSAYVVATSAAEGGLLFLF
jgi:hypothetical protein